MRHHQRVGITEMLAERPVRRLACTVADAKRLQTQARLRRWSACRHEAGPPLVRAPTRTHRYAFTEAMIECEALQHRLRRPVRHRPDHWGRQGGLIDT